MIYSNELTVREGLAKYFVVSGFGAPNYADRWVKVKLGPIPFAFPNTNARRRAVKLHDIHHVLTEFPTTWRGETQIGAWELASGCATHLPAWVLNSLACFIGLFMNPREMMRAWRMGRRVGNLYRSNYDEVLLNRRVGELRRELGIAPLTGE